MSYTQAKSLPVTVTLTFPKFQTVTRTRDTVLKRSESLTVKVDVVLRLGHAEP